MQGNEECLTNCWLVLGTHFFFSAHVAAKALIAAKKRAVELEDYDEVFTEH